MAGKRVLAIRKCRQLPELLTREAGIPRGLVVVVLQKGVERVAFGFLVPVLAVDVISYLDGVAALQCAVHHADRKAVPPLALELLGVRGRRVPVHLFDTLTVRLAALELASVRVQVLLAKVSALDDIAAHKLA